jgi:outer membrane lipoprotein
MRCNYKIYFAELLIVFFLQGCAHPISQEIRDGLDPVIKFESLVENPKSFIGKHVLFGGVIVVTRNIKDGTEVEMVHKNLDSYGNIVTGDYSGGRFLFLNKRYLEPKIYSPGRNLIGVGKVTGEKLGKVGDFPYRFPIIEVEELHLLDDVKFNPPYSPPYWDPWYRSRYWDPWFRSPIYGPYWPYYYR